MIRMGAISTKFYTYQFLTIGFCHHNTIFLDAPEFSPVMCRQKTGSEAGSSATKSGLPMSQGSNFWLHRRTNLIKRFYPYRFIKRT